ncbi:MAG: HNH endonuclease [Chloroflexota bacterium]|nr:HNH endonuclease [Chloroflexota bacterium]
MNAREAYAANPKTCLTCGVVLSFEQRRNSFCSKTCSATHNNRGVNRHNKNSNICSCGNIKRYENKYCDACIKKRVYNMPQKFEGLKDSVALKRFLIRERGHRCEDCGLESWKNQPIPLELHHIDGNADNNTRENLQLLCPNYHAFTPHYKGAVKGKHTSRQIRRRNLYAEGRPH